MLSILASEDNSRVLLAWQLQFVLPSNGHVGTIGNLDNAPDDEVHVVSIAFNTGDLDSPLVRLGGQ